MVAFKALPVEDSDSDAGLLMGASRRGGFDATFHRVESAEDMAAALVSPNFDLVISDYNQPDFNAPGALGVLQAANIDLLFIVVSGNIGEDSAVNLMKRGASDYILKDSTTRLPAVVQRELAKSKHDAKASRSTFAPRGKDI